MFGAATASLAERIVALAPRGIVLLDDHGMIVGANRRAYALLGYDNDELTGQPFTILVPERLRPNLPIPFKPEAVRDGGVLAEAYRSPARRKDGSEVGIVLSISSIRHDDRWYFAASVDRPPTPNQAADEPTDEWRHAPFIVTSVDRDLRYKGMYDPRRQPDEVDVIGKRADEVYSTPRIEQVNALRQRVLDSGLPETELVAFERRGKSFTYEMTASPEFDAAGNVTGVTTVAIDATEVARLVRSQREFLARVAHDLRSPLTVISVQAQRLLRREQFDEGALGSILEQTRRLSRMIDGLLTSAAVTAGQFELHREYGVDLPSIVRDVVTDLDTVEERSVAIEVKGAVQAGYWDPGRVRQIVENLLTNAVKYSPANTEIEVTLEDRGDHVMVSVRDYGHGIAPEDMEGLFTAFWRSESARGSETPGFGLGLPVVHELVAAHGGAICAESDGLGQGATFKFTLPYASR